MKNTLKWILGTALICALLTTSVMLTWNTDVNHEVVESRVVPSPAGLP